MPPYRLCAQWQVGDTVRHSLFSNPGTVLNIGKRGTLRSGQVEIEVFLNREQRTVQRWVPHAQLAKISRTW